MERDALDTLEEIAYLLGEMTPDERHEFRDVLRRVAAEQPDRADFIRGLPGSLGLDLEP